MPENKESKLVSNLTDLEKIEKIPTRFGYGEGIIEAGKKDENIVVLCCDLTDSTRSAGFKEKFPKRFIQMSIMEQSLVSIAAGMAMAGKTPWVASYAMFCPGRAWEQVRTNMALNDTNVKIAGAHSGVSVGPDGATHQAIEDIAIMRVIPRMTVIAPADVFETKKAVIAASKMKGPCYVRFTREKTPVFTTKDTPFKIGKANVLWDGDDVAIVACGPLVHNAILAAAELEKEKISVRVINMHTIKPLDEKTLLNAAKDCGAIVTLEEHQINGGLGGAVCEFLSENHPVPVERVGMRDCFGESGKPEELIEHFGMGIGSIKEAIKKVIKRK